MNARPRKPAESQAPPDLVALARDISLIVESIRGRDEAENPFTPEEIEQIKRGAQIVEWFDTLGWIGRRIMTIVAAAVLLITQWERIAAFFAPLINGAPK